MWTQSKTVQLIYLAVMVGSFAAAAVLLVTYTPVEKTMGPIQKIFYLHLPAAINAFGACLVAFVGGVGYLWQRKMSWDDLSAAAAKIAALLCTVVLVTGSIWGKVAWGKWWTWSPRLTFSLLLWLLYVVYLVIRPAIDAGPRRALVCAVYAIAAFLDVPLVYLSVRMMPDIHPVSASLTAPMKITLAVWFVPVTLLNVALIAAACGANRRRRTREGLREAETSWSVPTGDTAPPPA